MGKTKKVIALIVISIIFIYLIEGLTSKNFVNANSTELTNLTNEQISDIEELIQEAKEKGKLPGLFVAIIQGENTVYQEGFGYANEKEKLPVDETTLFEIGSNSKAFTALAILKLEKEGKIDLQKNITDYIPWLTSYYAEEKVEITLEQFMHHTSGIPFRTIDKIPESVEDNALEKTVRTLEHVNLDSRPGERFQYATINYDVLGLVIEIVTGESYENYINENILVPMNLTQTYTQRSSETASFMSTGYKYAYLKPVKFDAPVYRGNLPAGYLISSGADMVKWLKIQMSCSNDSDFEAELIEQSHVPNRTIKPLEDGSSYAAGWFVHQKGKGELSHDGANPNYSSSLSFTGEGLGIVVLSNINSGYVIGIREGISEILSGGSQGTMSDLNKMADQIALCIITCLVAIISALLVLITRILMQTAKKQKKIALNGIKGSTRILASCLCAFGLCCCVYLAPYIFYDGVSWGFVYVWLPVSVKLAVTLIYLCICLLCCYFILSDMDKSRVDNLLFKMVLFSLVGGFGNAFVIFIINMAMKANDAQRLQLLLYFILGLILYIYGQKVMRKHLIHYTNDIVFNKRKEIVEKLLKISYERFEQFDKGKIQSTLNNDTEVISEFANILVNGATSLITMVFCFLYLGFINKYALLLSLSIILFIAGIFYYVGEYAKRIGEKARDLQTIFYKFINDLLGGFKELSISQRKSDEFRNDMNQGCMDYKENKKRAAKAYANLYVIGELLFTVAIGVLIFIFPLLIKKLQTTSVTSYVFILLYMTGPVNVVLDMIPQIINVRISLNRINALIGEINTASDDKPALDPKGIFESINMKLNGIEFQYNTDDDRQFKIGPISYELNSGEIVFITGGNGSGKSTLIKLLSGLYLPSGGEIMLNGKKISGASLSQYYACVFSDFFLFDRLYGISYQGREDEINGYLILLQLDEKVQIINGRFSTTKLSTGQRKRLALLISYMEDKPIYLFDEWASDQDPEFREFFYHTLLQEMKRKNKCIISVTHDDRYFGLADKVIKMDMGKICKI